MDTFTPTERSDIMRRVHSRDTSPELALRRALWAANLKGYRVSPPSVPGKPDVAYIGKQIAVFVDGCFWHGCPKCYRRPSSNEAYWDAKVARNRQRDKMCTARLRRAGWSVLRCWEHDVAADVDKCVRKVQRTMQRRMASKARH